VIGFALFLGVAGAAYGAARLARADALPFLLVAGFVVSLLPVPVPRGLLLEAALVGLGFLLFLAAHELSPQRVSQFGRAAAAALALRVGAVGVVGFALAAAAGHAAAGALVIGMATGLASPTVAVRLLEERREFFDPGGRLAAGVLLLQGLLVVLALPAVTALGAGAGPGRAVAGVGAAAGLAAASYGFMRRVARYTVTHLELNEEIILLVVFSVLALFLGAAHLAGLPLLAGAFLGGFALSRFPVNGIIQGYLKSTSDLATAIAFPAIGALVVVPRGGDLALALLLVLAVLALPPALLATLGRPDGLTTRRAFRGGLLLAHTGELSLIVAIQAMVAGLATDRVLGLVLFVTAVTMLLAPVVSRGQWVWSLLTGLPPWHRPARQPAADHILILGLHGTDRPLLDAIREAGAHVVVVDDDPALVAGLREGGLRAILADATNPVVLRAAGAERARTVVVTFHPLADAERALRRLRGVPTIARVRTTGEARRAAELGAVPVLWAEPIARDFLAWMDEERRRPRKTGRS
jgi:monovalent cation:H+ antiporter-2, CPA2 family